MSNYNTFDKYLNIYNKTRDIERAARLLKQHKPVDMIKEAYELDDEDLPRIIEALKELGVKEDRITEIKDRFYGIADLLYFYKGDKAKELLDNLKSGKANLGHRCKNVWLDKDDARYIYLIERLEEKVNGQ